MSDKPTTDPNLLKKVCGHLGIDQAQVMKHRPITGWQVNQVVLVVDYGIKGCKKYVVDVDKIPAPPQPKAPVKKSARKANVRTSSKR